MRCCPAGAPSRHKWPHSRNCDRHQACPRERSERQVAGFRYTQPRLCVLRRPLVQPRGKGAAGTWANPVLKGRSSGLRGTGWTQGLRHRCPARQSTHRGAWLPGGVVPAPCLSGSIPAGVLWAPPVSMPRARPLWWWLSASCPLQAPRAPALALKVTPSPPLVPPAPKALPTPAALRAQRRLPLPSHRGTLPEATGRNPDSAPRVLGWLVPVRRPGEAVGSAPVDTEAGGGEATGVRPRSSGRTGVHRGQEAIQPRRLPTVVGPSGPMPAATVARGGTGSALFCTTSMRLLPPAPAGSVEPPQGPAV